MAQEQHQRLSSGLHVCHVCRLVWRLASIILALRMMKHDNCYEFQASADYCMWSHLKQTNKTIEMAQWLEHILLILRT